MGLVDAGEALLELTRLSAEIESAAVLDSAGTVRASTAGADVDRLACVAAELLDIAAPVRPDETVDRVEVSLSSGVVFVVRAGELVVIATTTPEPAAALVVHDLRTCLARIGPSPRPTAGKRRKADPVDA